MLRRLVALVLMLCFGLFTAEALLADVHDGDATHAELVRVDGDRHAERHAGEVTSAPDPEPVPGERAPGETGHSQHACHCVHAHGVWSPALTVLASATVLVTADEPVLDAEGPPSPALEPRLRPPNA